MSLVLNNFSDSHNNNASTVLWCCLFVCFTVFLFARQIHGGPEKRGHRLVTADLWDLNRFTKFFTERFLSKFALIGYAPCICCYTALWNINVGKTSINDKLLASVATFLGVVGLLITTLRKVDCWVCEWIFFKSVNIWQNYKQKRGYLMHCAPRQCAAKRRRKCTRQSRFCFYLCQIFADFRGGREEGKEGKEERSGERSSSFAPGREKKSGHGCVWTCCGCARCSAVLLELPHYAAVSVNVLWVCALYSAVLLELPHYAAVSVNVLWVCAL